MSSVDEVIKNLYVPKKELPDHPDSKDFYSKGEDGLWHFDYWWRKK